MLLLKRLHDDRDVALTTAASEVYYQTLNKYHTWYTAAAFTVVLKVWIPLSKTGMNAVLTGDAASA